MTRRLPPFRDWSLRSKLTLIITGLSVLGILLAAGTFAVYETRSSRDMLRSDLQSLAQIMGMNCEASLAFQDHETAAEVLASLSARPHITRARLYDRDGTLFSEYVGPPDTGTRLVVEHAIYRDAEPLGRVVIESDLSPVQGRIIAQLSMLLLILLVTILFVGLLSSKVQRTVSGPLQELSGVARRIARSRSYHLRARKAGNDELGELTDTFNTMLEEIQQRDAELQDAYHELDRRRQAEVAAEATLRQKVEAELKDSLEQLQQNQKMESIGRLAGGVAHDFNNMLTAISGYAQLLLVNLRHDEKLAPRVKGIAEATERASVLTRQLLAFSRKQVLEPRVMNLNETVANLREMLTRMIGERISLSAVLAPDLPAVEADPSQIDQVLMNLVINAADAMPEGGRARIETKTATADEIRAVYAGHVVEGKYVRLDVTDTGHGMDEDTASQVFEPFFTTKPRGKGTGLGLSTVYGIIKQSNGVITVTSTPGEGTTFSVFLPVTEQPAAREPSGDSLHVDVHLTSGSGTVLVAEDEELIRDYVTGVLENCGYTVLTAEDGSAAVEVVRNAAQPVDVIVSDVMMPNMTGPEAVDKIREINPHIGVIFMSGYTQDGGFRETLRRNRAAFLQKPFSAVDLSQTVREKLDLRQTA